MRKTERLARLKTSGRKIGSCKRSPRGHFIAGLSDQTLSLSPSLGAFDAYPRVGAVIIGLGSLAVLFSSDLATAGNCMESVPLSGNWSCNSPANPATDTTQNLTPGAIGGGLNVTTNAGFGITTTTGNAFTLENTGAATGDIVFTDTNGSAIAGQLSGLAVTNRGTGSLQVTSNGAVSGQQQHGIWAGNATTAANLSVTTGDVTGLRSALRAQHDGTGALTIDANGTIVSRNQRGIDARTANRATGGTNISTMDVTGATDGIFARHLGAGALQITVVGTVSGTGVDGIRASNAGQSSDLTISARTASGARDGISVINNGSGALSIGSAESVSGNTGRGVDARNAATATNLTVSVRNVSGGSEGIFAQNLGTGTLSITTNGNVSGGTGYAIDTETNTGARTEIALNSGTNVSGTSGLAIRNNGGDSVTTLNSGASVNGVVQLNAGRDDFVLAGGALGANTILSGGDGFDTVFQTNQNYDLVGKNIRNFESFVADGGRLSFNDNFVAIGDGSASTGLFLRNGAILNAGTQFALMGNLNLSSGVFQAAGGGSGAYTVSGNVTNNGTITTQDGAVGDQITIRGDYAGSGQIRLDTSLAGPGATSDRIVITGNASGTGTVNVQNVGGQGDVTQTEIEVVTVAGGSTANFTLSGGNFVTPSGEGALIAGAYVYTLRQNSAGNWSLVSGTGNTPFFQPAIPVYETYARNLQALNAFPSLRQRVGDRHERALASMNSADVVDDIDSGSPLWVRLQGSDLRVDPQNSSTNARADIDVFNISGGMDFLLLSGSNGYLVGGPTLEYSKADSSVSSSFGNGRIDTTGYSFGLASTWYGHSGFYVDGQLKYNWYDSDLTSDSLGELINGNNGTGYGASIELGRTFETGNRFSITPQAQLSYTSVNFDSFSGPNGERVDPTSAKSTLARLGILAEYQSGNDQQPGSIYGLFNLYHEFEGNAQVFVSGREISSDLDAWAAEIGAGTSYAWNPTASAYGEISYATGLEDFGDSRRIQVNLGINVLF